MTAALIILYVLGMLLAIASLNRDDAFDSIEGNRIAACFVSLLWPLFVAYNVISDIYDWFKGN